MLTQEAQALNEKKDRVELLQKLQLAIKDAEDGGLHPMDVIGIAEYAVRQYEAFHFGTCLYDSMTKTRKEKGQK